MNRGPFEHDGFDDDDKPFGGYDVAEDLQWHGHARNGENKSRKDNDREHQSGQGKHHGGLLGLRYGGD